MSNQPRALFAARSSPGSAALQGSILFLRYVEESGTGNEGFESYHLPRSIRIQCRGASSARDTRALGRKVLGLECDLLLRSFSICRGTSRNLELLAPRHGTCSVRVEHPFVTFRFGTTLTTLPVMVVLNEPGMLASSMSPFPRIVYRKGW